MPYLTAFLSFGFLVRRRPGRRWRRGQRRGRCGGSWEGLLVWAVIVGSRYGAAGAMQMSGRRTTLMSSPMVTPAIPPAEGRRPADAQVEHRSDAMPELKKAELIYGVVYMGSPVSQDRHGGPHFDVITWLGVYRALTPGVDGGDNSSIRLEGDDERPGRIAVHPARPRRARPACRGLHRGGAGTGGRGVGQRRRAGPGPEVPALPGERGPGVRHLAGRSGGGRVARAAQGQYQRLAAHPDGTLRSEAFPAYGSTPPPWCGATSPRADGGSTGHRDARVRRLRPAARRRDISPEHASPLGVLRRQLVADLSPAASSSP